MSCHEVNPCRLPRTIWLSSNWAAYCALLFVYTYFIFTPPCRSWPFSFSVAATPPPPPHHHHRRPHHYYHLHRRHPFELYFVLRLLCFPWTLLFVFISVSLFAGFVCHLKNAFCSFFFSFLRNSIVDCHSRVILKKITPSEVYLAFFIESRHPLLANNILVSSGSSEPAFLHPACAFWCRQ